MLVKMTTSAHGLAVIKNFEGLRLRAYQDIAGIWTIGYGSTRYQQGIKVKKGDILINEAQASVLFRVTLREYEAAVNQYVHVPLTQNQFDALVSFTYNTGVGALRSSSMLKRLNEGNYSSAANQLLVWNKITDPNTGAKIVSNTLLKRRNQERKLFITN
jgi:lysozyme